MFITCMIVQVFIQVKLMYEAFSTNLENEKTSSLREKSTKAEQNSIKTILRS